MHALGLFVVLFALWLLLSGFFEALLLGFGLASCLLVVIIGWRMDVIDHEGLPIHLGWRLVTYWPWLFWEIVKSNIAVAKLILDPALPISPQMIRARATQLDELGRVIFANSITLTPGTVSIQVSDDDILVHAVDDGSAEGLATGEMDRRVALLDPRARRALTGRTGA